MKKNQIKLLLIKMRTQKNEAYLNHLLGLIDMISEEELQTKLEKLNVNDENIKDFLTAQIDKNIRQQEQSNQFTNVNKMFCYGRNGDTIHMHLIPKDLRPLKSELGDEAFYNFFKEQLADFLSRIQDIVRNDSTIKSLFAVSPIFYNTNISLAHVDLGFNEIIEIDIENKEDKMSKEQKEIFLNMFNKDSQHQKRVYYTSISREKLLKMEYSRISKDER